MRRKLFLIIIISMPYILLSQLPEHLAESPKKEKIKVKQQSNKLYFLATESFPLEESGQHYLQNNFVVGTITDFEDEEIDVPIRYRFVDDEMQIKHLNKVKALYPPKIKTIIFKVNDEVKTFIPTEYVEKKMENVGYFEVISMGKIKLLKAYRKKGKNGMKSYYFTQRERELAKPIKLKKSSILRIFDKQKSTISKYIANNNINIKSEAGLKKVFDYYNSLEK